MDCHQFLWEHSWSPGLEIDIQTMTFFVFNLKILTVFQRMFTKFMAPRGWSPVTFGDSPNFSFSTIGRPKFSLIQENCQRRLCENICTDFNGSHVMCPNWSDYPLASKWLYLWVVTLLETFRQCNYTIYTARFSFLDFFNDCISVCSR